MENNSSILSQGIYEELPRFIKELTDEYEGRERDMILLSTLGVLSDCFPNYYSEYDGRKVYPHLYLAILANAASGKGVINISRKLLEPIHKYVQKDNNLFEVSDEDLIPESKEESKKNKKPSESNSVKEIKILPGNISSAEMHSYFNKSKHGMLIMESEADTVGAMLKNDWANYSDVLRKVFHNEPISISRSTDGRFFEINNPMLSIVLSGTPNQLSPIISSVENGLFSRFIYYYFDEPQKFKNVFQKTSLIANTYFEKKGSILLDVYKMLEKVNIEFKLTCNQQEKFLEFFTETTELIQESDCNGLDANVKRLGNILLKILQIFSICRRIDDINRNNLEEIICDDIDFKIGILLVKELFEHTKNVFINNTKALILSDFDKSILDNLVNEFSRQDAVNIGKEMNITIRTIDDKLSQWCNKKIIIRVFQGKYKKVI
ncbi:Protein of unknown function [Algoriella xinjiangensis]|uniref:DUF3987 domain-containing protein n=1 Tax=Algoriella xinjiangensis TaxID=684065 RepID=A0A1I4YWR6_9FLAO|nr:DUF3987 domain-containing protein [Algoriella xinjiangensis]SFN42099.1 Protein of unknown function [Algoriella xinjiangensis]